MKEIDDAFEEYSRNVERAYEKFQAAHHRDIRAALYRDRATVWGLAAVFGCSAILFLAGMLFSYLMMVGK
jgi:hypothetical protein